MNIFDPFTTYTPPSRRAVVWIAATSDPPDGSVIARHEIFSPRRIAGRVAILSDASGLLLPERFPQRSLENFARRALRKLTLVEFKPARNLIIGQAIAAVFRQFVRAERRAVLQHHACRHAFAPLRIR